jgi:acylphosphatase
MRRAHIIISGSVQGVFFRAFAAKLANSYGIVGWVQNTDDGGVEVVAEGDTVALSHFTNDLKKGPEGAEITKFEVKDEKPTGEFKNFRIRF